MRIDERMKQIREGRRERVRLGENRVRLGD